METRGHRGPVHDAACSPTDHVLATADADGSVRLWDLESGKLLRILLAHEHAIRAVAWSPDGKTLAALGAAGIADLWDPESGRLLLTIHTGPSRRPGLVEGRRPPGDRRRQENLYLGGADGQAASSPGRASRRNPPLAWSPDGKITAGVADRVVRLWEPGGLQSHNFLPAMRSIARSTSQAKASARARSGRSSWGSAVARSTVTTALSSTAKPNATPGCVL